MHPAPSIPSISRQARRIVRTTAQAWRIAPAPTWLHTGSAVPRAPAARAARQAAIKYQSSHCPSLLHLAPLSC